MGIVKVSTYIKNHNFADGAEVPISVKIGNEWVKAGSGTYDAKNNLVHADIDSDTAAGLVFLNGLANHNLVRFN